MARVNLKHDIANILANTTSLADFSTDYPQELNTFPYAIYRTVTTPVEIDANRQELQTRWDIIIEVYGESSVSSIVDEITLQLQELGLRVGQKDSHVAGLKRIVISGYGIIDNATSHIYL